MRSDRYASAGARCRRWPPPLGLPSWRSLLRPRSGRPFHGHHRLRCPASAPCSRSPVTEQQLDGAQALGALIVDWARLGVAHAVRSACATDQSEVLDPIARDPGNLTCTGVIVRFGRRGNRWWTASPPVFSNPCLGGFAPLAPGSLTAPDAASRTATRWRATRLGRQGRYRGLEVWSSRRPVARPRCPMTRRKFCDSFPPMQPDACAPDRPGLDGRLVSSEFALFHGSRHPEAISPSTIIALAWRPQTRRHSRGKSVAEGGFPARLIPLPEARESPLGPARRYLRRAPLRA